MTYYPALIRKETDSDFGVEFPDFPGCVTAAPTQEEAMDLASEALRFHVEGLIEDGETIPDPMPLETVLESAEARGAAAFLVRLSPPKSRAVRVNITIDESLLADIDAASRQQGTTRSGFLSKAALNDPFVARLRAATPKGGRALDGIKRVIAKENKKRLISNHPPDISNIGVSDQQRERKVRKSKSRKPTD